MPPFLFFGSRDHCSRHCSCTHSKAASSRRLRILKLITCLTLMAMLAYSIRAQAPVAPASAANSVQLQAQGSSADKKRELQIPAGTPLEIESTYTVNSRDLHAGDFLSFRVLVPIKFDGVTVISENALVTA